MHEINKKIIGRWQDNLPSSDVTLVIADPVYEDNFINELLNEMLPISTIMFMFPKNIYNLKYEPDQICHWIKPISTKNTKKRYSNFVEVIAMWDVNMNSNLYWANRTGVFTDCLFSNDVHPWKKPESLIKRLIFNHYQDGRIYDPCAGSFTVHDVCVELGIPSTSVEINS